MNKKIFTAVIALSVAVGSAFAQTKQLSAPNKTETTAPSNTTSQGDTKQTTSNQTAPIKTTPQSVTPPEVVVSKFKLMYPSVKEVKWMQNKQGNYVAQFKNTGAESRTAYNADGSVVRELMVVEKSALPTGVLNYLDKNFSGKTPKHCEQIKNAKGKMIYLIKYDDKVVRLDANGNEIKQTEEMEETK